MNLLILGGTRFLGRHLVTAALERAHAVSLFNRGSSQPFPDVETLVGDRDGNLEALKGRSWDAVIDTSGYVPRVVGASTNLLKDAVSHYTFISSISVYADFSKPGVNERSPVLSLDNAATENVEESYGALKAACEPVVQKAFPNKALIVRPGLIVGPYDPTGRFTYWVDRVAAGGTVLAPGKPDRLVQLIDARDLADWIVRQVEQQQTGTYNATGPAEFLTMETLLHACQRASQSKAQFEWVSEPFLIEHQVNPWIELPLWIPAGEMDGFMQINCDRAIQAGLHLRSLSDTVRDTLSWSQMSAADSHEKLKAGLTRDRELILLNTWHKTKSNST